MKREILAPAGAFEQLEAAVRSGADAVYLGYGSFNARRNAKNFTFDELCKAVDYCHVRGVKVHAALNTLVTEKELRSAYDDIVSVAKAGVDAVIVQDLGVAKMVKQFVPELEMHASTQLSVHNVSGVKQLEEFGFKRAVLARELSLSEIEEICKSTDIEIEVFIHGALCMSFSGCCYLSSVLGQRSGNRGLCAQPCRLDFKLENKNYALSLKDMSHIKYIHRLAEAGVCSFKIEGRMKRPEYVAAAVSACKTAIDGKEPDLKTLQAVFSRSGFTDGYLTASRNADMFGHRSKEDVTAAASVLKEIAAGYRNEAKRVSIDINISVKKGSEVSLLVSDGSNFVSVKGDIPDEAVTRAITEDEVVKQIGKTGGTPYFVNSIDVSVEDGLTLPLSHLNALRRDALERLSALRCKKKDYKILPFCLPERQKRVFSQTKYVIRVLKYSQLELIDGNAAIVLPLKEITREALDRFKFVCAELPALIFGEDESKISALIEEKKALGLKYLWCENVGAVYLAKKAGLTAIGGYGLNLINSNAVEVASEMGIKAAVVSFETSASNLNLLKSDIPLGIIGYGHLPLMEMRACPKRSKNGCGDCKGHGTVTDRMNIRFPLLCNERRFTTLLNSVPLYVADKGIDAEFTLLYFNTESPKRVAEIYKMYRQNALPDFDRTTGLYFKSLK